MERAVWTDERIDDGFGSLRGDVGELREDLREVRNEIRDMRTEMHAELSTMKLFMLGQLVTILAAILASAIALHG
jgi:hypothetical protein